LLITSIAEYPNMRSAPTLKIWITPFASVAMLEKFALFKMAVWSAPAFSNASSETPEGVPSGGTGIAGTGGRDGVGRGVWLNVALRPIASGSEVFETSAIGAVYKDPNRTVLN
jgi:hypothetical protein